MRFDLVQAVGKVKGHFAKKENRAAKLISMWPSLQRKLEGMVVRGKGRTEQARCAYAILVMMETGIRIGNEDSAEGFVCENKFDKERYGKTVQTFGLTTLRGTHVYGNGPRGSFIRLSFTGKKHVDQQLMIYNRTLIRFCPDVGADELWLGGITDAQLRKFVKRYVGRGFSPKDIRTAKVNILFVNSFAEDYGIHYVKETTKSGRKKVVASCIAEVANRIGHTKAVCRSAYLSKPLLANILMTESGYVYVSSLTNLSKKI